MGESFWSDKHERLDKDIERIRIIIRVIVIIAETWRGLWNFGQNFENFILRCAWSNCSFEFSRTRNGRINVVLVVLILVLTILESISVVSYEAEKKFGTKINLTGYLARLAVNVRNPGGLFQQYVGDNRSDGTFPKLREWKMVLARFRLVQSYKLLSTWSEVTLGDTIGPLVPLPPKLKVWKMVTEPVDESVCSRFAHSVHAFKEQFSRQGKSLRHILWL